MRALVVYESMFGNTKHVAQAVAEGLQEHVAATVVGTDEAGAALDSGVELLVVGGPTHAHGLSRRSTREGARRRVPVVRPDDRGLREWLDTVPEATGVVAAATFDTRFSRSRWLTGSAAVRAGRALRKRGYPLAVPPESFFVTDATGPLAPGEVERARRWGERLGSTVAGAKPAEQR